MRTRHATALSIAGVLAAGVVAALVNAQALAGSGGRAATSLASTQLVASTSVPASVTTSPASVVDPPPLVFALGASGTVTLDDVDGVLDVVAIAPASGWSVSAMTSVDATTVAIDFVSAGTSVRATAVLRDSVITVELVESPSTQPIPTPTTTVPPTAGTATTTPMVPTSAPRDDDSSGHGSDDLAGNDGDSPDD